jgi:hypothetical protein
MCRVSCLVYPREKVIHDITGENKNAEGQICTFYATKVTDVAHHDR